MSSHVDTEFYQKCFCVSSSKASRMRVRWSVFLGSEKVEKESSTECSHISKSLSISLNQMLVYALSRCEKNALHFNVRLSCIGQKEYEKLL